MYHTIWRRTRFTSLWKRNLSNSVSNAGLPKKMSKWRSFSLWIKSRSFLWVCVIIQFFIHIIVWNEVNYSNLNVYYLRNEHQCLELCEADGICKVTTEPKKKEEVYKGLVTNITFTKVCSTYKSQKYNWFDRNNIYINL